VGTRSPSSIREAGRGRTVRYAGTTSRIGRISHPPCSKPATSGRTPSDRPLPRSFSTAAVPRRSRPENAEGRDPRAIEWTPCLARRRATTLRASAVLNSRTNRRDVPDPPAQVGEPSRRYRSTGCARPFGRASTSSPPATWPTSTGPLVLDGLARRLRRLGWPSRPTKPTVLREAARYREAHTTPLDEAQTRRS
jgi:hypothetical protein